MKLVPLLVGALAAVAIALPTDLEHNENVLGPTDQLVTVAYGSAPQNIGDLKRGEVYDQVYQALNKLCPVGQTHCTLGRDEKHKVEISVNAMPSNYARGIIHSTVWVWVEHSTHYTEELRRLLIGVVASSVEAMVDPGLGLDKKNCFVYNAGVYDPDHELCNIANYVGVQTTDRQNLLDVHFEAAHKNMGYDKPGDKQKFDCEGSLVGMRTLVNTLLPEFKPQLGGRTFSKVFCMK